MPNAVIYEQVIDVSRFLVAELTIDDSVLIRETAHRRPP